MFLSSLNSEVLDSYALQQREYDSFREEVDNEYRLCERGVCLEPEKDSISKKRLCHLHICNLIKEEKLRYDKVQIASIRSSSSEST